MIRLANWRTVEMRVFKILTKRQFVLTFKYPLPFLDDFNIWLSKREEYAIIPWRKRVMGIDFVPTID